MVAMVISCESICLCMNTFDLLYFTGLSFVSIFSNQI
jgi:hypothetical protein